MLSLGQVQLTLARQAEYCDTGGRACMLRAGTLWLAYRRRKLV
jgi:hypothetical protein